MNGSTGAEVTKISGQKSLSLSSDQETLEQKVVSIWELVSCGRDSIAHGDLAKLIKVIRQPI